MRLDVVDGRRELTPAAADDIRERLLRRREQPLGRRVVVRCDDVHGDHRVGLLELRRGLEAGAVHLERREQQIGREVRRERIRETERRGQLRAVEARPEDPERHVRPDAGNREHRLSGQWIAEQRLQLQHVLRERVGGRILPQGAQRDLVGAGRAAEAEIDASRVERLERAEHLDETVQRCGSAS